MQIIEGIVDVLPCAHCGGRLRLLGELTDPPQVTPLLHSLGILVEAPRAARARHPTELLGQAAEE